jgi:hypothetical protein
VQHLGFHQDEAESLSEARPTHQVGALDPAVSRQAFLREVNATFQPAH